MNTLKPTIYGILTIAIALGIFYWGLNLFDHKRTTEDNTITTILNALHPKKEYLYNAYAPGYDEYFIVKSYSPMPIDTIVHFDDNAVVTDQKTGYTCKILSPYIR